MAKTTKKTTKKANSKVYPMIDSYKGFPLLRLSPFFGKGVRKMALILEKIGSVEAFAEGMTEFGSGSSSSCKVTTWEGRKLLVLNPEEENSFNRLQIGEKTAQNIMLNLDTIQNFVTSNGKRLGAMPDTVKRETAAKAAPKEQSAVSVAQSAVGSLPVQNAVLSVIPNPVPNAVTIQVPSNFNFDALMKLVGEMTGQGQA